jgi:hypothetical protein
MKVTKSFIAALALVLAFSSFAPGKDKKSQNRGMLESMQSVPCGAKERGLTGLGAIYGSIGVTHVNSDEKLCPQYLLRTDEMDYHIRPVDLKHAVVLPVGHEAEFKIKKDRLFLKVVDGDKKTLAYQVVSMQPANSDTKTDNTAAYHPAEKPADSRPSNNVEGSKVTGPPSDAPPPQ